MDLMDKLASLAQRYEELNTLMAQPEVLDDIPLLQRYGREHAELEEVVQIYHELSDNERQIAEAQEMYGGSDEPEMRDLAYEEIERLKATQRAIARTGQSFPAAQRYHGREKRHRHHPGRCGR